MSRQPVAKTYKLYIDGAFPRSESGRSYEAQGANVAWGSRKDLRDAVRAARGAFGGWSGRTAYNRGQVLYRVAEVMEGRSSQFTELGASTQAEVEEAIDTWVWYAGWADKLAQVLGSANPVAGPVLQLHGAPAKRRGRRTLAPEDPPLLGLARTARARAGWRQHRRSSSHPRWLRSRR